MYRVSREGRRASAHEHDPDSRPARYNKERFDADAYHGKNKGFAPAAGAAGVLPTRNPRAVLCLKATAAFVVLFFVRGVSVHTTNRGRSYPSPSPWFDLSRLQCSSSRANHFLFSSCWFRCSVV